MDPQLHHLGNILRFTSATQAYSLSKFPFFRLVGKWFGCVDIDSDCKNIPMLADILIFNWAFTAKSASMSVHRFALITQKL